MNRSSKQKILQNCAILSLHTLLHPIRNISRKRVFRGTSPHHTSCQNKTFEPFPTSYLTWATKASYPLLIHFQTPTPKEPPTSLVHQPPLILLYLISTTFLQRASLFKANLHSHLPIKALINLIIFITPNPPETFDEQIVCQLTK